MNRRRWLHLAAMAFLMVCGAFYGWRAIGQSGPAPAAPGKRVRIGVYDPRIVAVAFASSAQHNQQLNQMIAERDRARAAGDKARVAELENQASGSQVKKHLQAFCGFPVDDLLAVIKDDLPRIAREAGVVAIVPCANYVSPDAETVDLTDSLIQPFQPDARVKKIAKELRGQPLLDPAQVLAHKD